uniref:Protein Hikeshi n=1 Tax=Sus scrofa TaxID=9823 RepID=A0A8D1LWC6_PIG
ALLLPAKLYETKSQILTKCKFVFLLPDHEKLIHVLAFMLGHQIYPEKSLGSLHFMEKDGNSLPRFQLSFIVTKGKISNIFILGGKKKGEKRKHPFGIKNISQSPSIAQICLLVEELSFVNIQKPCGGKALQSIKSFSQFQNWILNNFTTLAISFVVSQTRIMPSPENAFVCLNLTLKWYNSYQRKIECNRLFYKK